MKEIVALVGRTNVGKSLLFNKLTKSKKSLVIDNNNLTVFKAVKIIIDNVINNFLFSHKAR